VIHFQPARQPLHLMKKLLQISLTLLICCTLSNAFGAAQARDGVRVAVLDFGDVETGARVSAKLSAALSPASQLSVEDRDEARAAALGVGYRGSVNMTLAEARNLGAALGCDFFITGRADTLRRWPSTGAIYYESFASIFIVSARTGRLILWERPHFEAPSQQEAESALLNHLKGRAPAYAVSILDAEVRERGERESAASHAAPLIEEAPDTEETATASGLRLPMPYRRLRPQYTAAAAQMEVEAVVDVLVDVGADGSVSRAEVVRWAGYELDESALTTVHQLYFRPATRNGEAIPMRVLLRYNFRKPPREQ